jgi:hypothetical protein
VRVIPALPGVGEKGDVSDWLDTGGTVEELFELIERADQWKPPALIEDARRLDELDFYTMAQLVEAVDGEEPCGWLCRPIWPADAYGVLAAEKKAGKTWAMLDLVVSVASGTPWLGVYAVERSGPVLVFLGEGGRRKMLRRLRAVCDAKGVRVEALPIVASFRAPHLTNQEALTVVSDKLAEVRPVLMVIDPLYLAARGAKSSSLYDMGTHLENVQAIAQRAGAALVIAHHWNQTGTGRGADRMSGAGPAEWGRVLASVEVEHRQTDPESRATAVTLGFTFIGDEIPDTDLRIRRRVWSSDPDHLDSTLHYEVEVLDTKAPAPSADRGLSPATARVLAVLEGSATALTVREIGDVLATDSTGIPLKKRTIQDSLAKLREAGLAGVEEGLGAGGLWSSAHPPAQEAEQCL